MNKLTDANKEKRKKEAKKEKRNVINKTTLTLSYSCPTLGVHYNPEIEHIPIVHWFHIARSQKNLKALVHSSHFQEQLRKIFRSRGFVIRDVLLFYLILW